MASPSDHAASLNAVRADKSFFGHPRGLATLFFTEMWERFSYYGMRAMLIFYMTASVAKGGLGFADSKAGAVYGLYTSMVYLMCLPGGWIADRLIGAAPRRADRRHPDRLRRVLPGRRPRLPSFYLGLVLLVCGTGLLKGNVSIIVGQLYAQGDQRRDSGFSIFYMGINLGALISPLICGWVGERISWRLGFGVAGLGMLAGLVQYLLTSRHLGSAGLHPASTGNAEEDRREKQKAIRALGIGVAVVAFLAALGMSGVVELTATMISDGVGWCLLGISVLVFSWLIFFGNWSPVERKRSAAILVLFVSSALFWAAFEQAGSSLSLFAERGTDCTHLRVLLSRKLVPVRAADLRDRAGARLRLALAGNGPQGTIQPGQICARPVVGRIGLCDPGPRRLHGGERREGRALLADRDLPAPDAGRVVPEPGGVERHDQARAGARRGLHDGHLVPLHQHRQLAGRQGGLDVQLHAAADSVRLGRRLQHRRRHRAGDFDQAYGATDARREVG